MKPAVKFLFDTSFDVDATTAKPRVDAAAAATRDAPPELTKAPPPPPPPSFTEADLAAVRREAHAQGRAEGEAAALASIAQTNGAVLAAIREALPGIARAIEEGMANARRHMLETTLAGLRRLMPDLNRRGGLAEIEGLLRETLTHLPDESRLVVRLNDSLLDGLRADLDPLARSAGFEGKLVLLAEEDIAPGDCRIEWADGGVERVAARVWADIEAAMSRALTATTADAGPVPVAAETSMTAGPDASASAGKPQET